MSPEIYDPRRGERGPHGDHGQTGDTGDTGDTGRTGPAGRAGATGARGGFSAHQAVAVFAFVVLVFVVLSLYGEYQRRAVAQDLHNQCMVSATNAEAMGDLIDVIVERVGKTMPAGQERDDAVALYTTAKPKVPDCGTR